MGVSVLKFIRFAVLYLVIALVLAVPAAGQSGELVYFDGAAENGQLSGGKAEIYTPLLATMAASEGVETSITTVLDSGRSDNRVDLVFLGDGFTSSETSTYQVMVNTHLNYMLTEDPLLEYSTYFNAHRIDAASADSGIDNENFFGQRRDTVLDMEFWCHGNQETLCLDVAKAWEMAAQAPDVDQIIALANSRNTGGSAYPFSDLSLVTSLHSLSGENLLHQFGHSFANLADEYDTGSWTTYTGFEPAEPNVSANARPGMIEQRIKWYRWLEHDSGDAYGGVILAFQGAMGHKRDIFRPTYDSKMRTLGKGFNSPSIESFITEIYRVVDPIDEAAPNRSGIIGAETLYVIPMEPVGRSLPIQWYINGEAINGANGETFVTDDYPLVDGTYTVKVVVLDDTPLVRNEENRERLMTSERSWQVEVNQFTPVITDEIEDKTVRVGETATFSLSAIGGGLSYQWYKNGVLIENASGPSYTTPEAVHADDQAQFWVKVSNLEGTTESYHAKLTVLNYAPVVSGIPSQVEYYRDTIEVNVSASDRDEDSLTYSASASKIYESDIEPAIDFTFDGSTLRATTREYTSPEGRVRYWGSFWITVAVNDGYDTTTTKLQGRFINRSPVFVNLQDQNYHWREPSGSIDISAIDGDGDDLTYSVDLNESYAGVDAQLSLEGTTLSIQGSEAQTSFFMVDIHAHDTVLSKTSKTIRVQVSNTTPTCNGITNKTMHWRDDVLEVPVVMADANNDPLTLSGSLVGDPGVAVDFRSVDGTLVIDPAEGFLGSFQVKATVSDGLASISRNFNVTVTNTAPTLPSRNHVERNWSLISLPLNLNAGDADDDPLTYVIETFAYRTSYELASTYGFTQADSSWRFNHSKVGDRVFAGKASGEDTEQYYAIAAGGQVYNWFGSRSVSTYLDWFVRSYERDPMLLVTPRNPDIALPLTLREDDGNLVIESNEPFSGTFGVRVTVSDSVDSATEEFLFTSYNERPLLMDINGLFRTKVISERSEHMHWRTDTKDLEAIAFDRDERMDEAAPQAELRYYDTQIAYDLDQTHNFTWISEEGEYESEGDSYGAKYISGVFEGSNARFAILRHGAIFVLHNGWESFESVGLLPPVYHAHPNLLFDVLPPAKYNPVELSVQNATSSGDVTQEGFNPSNPNISIDAIANPEQGFAGTLLLDLQLSDEISTDSIVLPLDVTNTPPELEEIDDRIISWSGTQSTVAFSASDADGDPLSYRAYAGTETNLIHGLVEDYSFRAHPDGWRLNERGWGEKWFLGTVDGGERDFAILPNGAIYLWNGSFAESTVVAKVSENRYLSPAQLWEIESEPVDDSYSVSIEGGAVTILYPTRVERAYTVTIQTTDGNAWDEERFTLYVRNTAPVLGHIEDQRIHWRADPEIVNLVATDADNDPLTFSTSFYDTSHEYQLDQLYDFQESEDPYAIDLMGHNEKHFYGVSETEHYIVFPSGMVCSIDDDFNLVRELGFIDPIFYRRPELLIDLLPPHVENPAELALNDNVLDTIFTRGFTGKLFIQVRVSDGHLFDQQVFLIDVYDNRPELEDFSEFTECPHWLKSFRQDKAILAAPASDKDDQTEDVPLEMSTFAGTSAHLAYDLDALYDFTEHNDGFRLNFHGWGAKWFKGTDAGAEVEFVITPGGALHYWQGSFADSPILEYFPVEYFEDPSLLFNVSPQPVAVPAEVDISFDGGSVVVNPPANWLGAVYFSRRAFDGNRLDEHHCGISFVNFGVYLETPPELRDHWSRDSFEHTLYGYDGDGDPISFGIAPLDETAAYEFDQTHDFTVPRGVPEELRDEYTKLKRFTGTRNSGETYRYAIISSGSLYSMDNGWDSRVYLGNLDRVYYRHPHLLNDVPKPFENHPASVELDGTSLTIDFVHGYVGRFILQASATDGVNTTYKSFPVELYNNAPKIEKIEDISTGWKENNPSVSVSVSDPDSDPTTVEARIGTIASFIYDLDQTHDFRLSEADYQENRYGWGEKHLQGASGSYVILPSGALYQWTGSFLSSVRLAFLPEEYFETPSLLFNAPEEPVVAGADVVVENNRVTVIAPEGFTGEIPVLVTVDDDNSFDFQTFLVYRENRPPTLANIGDRFQHWRIDSFVVPLEANDPDGDELEYSAVLSNAPDGTVVSFSDGVMRVTPGQVGSPPRNWLGTVGVRVYVSDGTNSVNRLTHLSRTNNHPTQQKIGPQEISWRKGSIELPLSGTDADEADVPHLSWDFELLTNEENTSGSIEDDKLRLSFREDFLGVVDVWIKLSDGASFSSQRVLVTVSNTSPVLESIPAQSMHWRDEPIEVNLVASDIDGDEISFSAALPSRDAGAAQVTLNGSKLTIDPSDGYLGTFSVDVQATDGDKTAKRSFTVSVTNSTPVLQNPGDQALGWRERKVELELAASDADGDPIEYSAYIPSGYSSYGSVHLDENRLTVERVDDFIGTILVVVSASDTVSEDTEQFFVLFENHAPVLTPVPQQYMSWKDEQRTITLTATDEDDDDLVFSAKLRDGTTFPATLSLDDNVITVTLLEETTGVFVIEAEVSDGKLKDSHAFAVNVGNTPPVIDLIPHQRVEKGSGAMQIRLEATDRDGDELSFTANAHSMDAFVYELDQEHDFALDRPSYFENMLGNNEKYFQGSKGTGNYGYWYVIFPDGTLYQWSGQLSTSEFLGGLSTSYHEDPSKLFDVANPGSQESPAEVSIDGRRLTLTPDNSFVGDFFVIVEVSDGLATDSTHFVVTVFDDSDGSTPPSCELQARLHEGEYSGPTATTAFTSEGRVGDSATGPGNRTFEVDVSQSTAGPFSAGETANYVWENGQETPFELIYDAESDMALFTIDGVTTAHETSVTDPLTDIFIRARAAKANSSMEIKDLFLNGESIEGSVEASDELGGVNVLQLLGGTINSGFTLSGKATMSWGGRNLVVNGGFEEPLTDGWALYTSEQIPGWSVAWLSGESPCNSSDPVTEAVIELQHNAAVPAYEGDQIAELDSDCDAPNVNQISSSGQPEATVRLWQDLETEPGKRYELRFVYRARPGNHGAQTMTVRWDGVDLMTDVTAPGQWTEIVMDVVAQDSSSRLEFMDTGDANTFGILLDAVSVESVQTVTPKNSELAFQISMANVEGHQPCEGDGNGGGPGGEVCTGEAYSVGSPNYTVWNSFLDMTNILELVNGSDTAVPVHISFYSILGELAHERDVTVGARSQLDVILNEFPGFVANSYGIVELEFQGSLDGRMTYYRSSATSAGYDFVFALPLEEASYGTTAVSFNTFQPSYRADERENLVANWLTIINLDAAPQTFLIWTYDQTGTLLMRREIEVPAFGRADVDGGHDIAGPSVVGMHKIVPEDISVRYIAQLTRFGGNAPAGFAPSEYRFAFPLVAKHGSTEAVYAPISNRLGEDNWLEVVNIKDQEIRVGINLYSSAGELLESIDSVLAPHAQFHIDASAILPTQSVGYAMVKPNIPKSIIAQSMFYFKDQVDGSVTSLYGSQGRAISGCAQTGSYNLFLGMENWLTVANSSDQPLQVSIALDGSQVASSNVFDIPARGAITLPLHDATVFEAPADSYGLVSVLSSRSEARIFTEVLRLRKGTEGEVDFSVPIAVR